MADGVPVRGSCAADYAASVAVPEGDRGQGTVTEDRGLHKLPPHFFTIPCPLSPIPCPLPPMPTTRRTLYPAIEPYRSGYLRVSPLHEIY